MSKRSVREKRRKKQKAGRKSMGGMQGGLTMSQAAAEIGVTDETIRNWLADNKHPLYGKAIRYAPKIVRIPRAAWDEFMRSRPAYIPSEPKRGKKDAAPAA